MIICKWPDPLDDHLQEAGSFVWSFATTTTTTTKDRRGEGGDGGGGGSEACLHLALVLWCSYKKIYLEVAPLLAMNNIEKLNRFTISMIIHLKFFSFYLKSIHWLWPLSQMTRVFHQKYPPDSAELRSIISQSGNQKMPLTILTDDSSVGRTVMSGLGLQIRSPPKISSGYERFSPLCTVWE